MKNYYSEQEFEELRNKIAKVVTEDEMLKNVFAVKRTSYKQAQKNNWNIIVNINTKGYTLHGDGNEKTNLVKRLITKYQEFINENELYFSDFNTRNGCVFYFVFQPIVIAAKNKLMK